MNCPLCHADSSVIRTDGNRRRRECVNCKYRWSTLELGELEISRLRRVAEVASSLTVILRDKYVPDLSR